jgi:hypothetical protein
MASGKPSNRRHTSTTAARFASVNWKLPAAAAARSTNSRTASLRLASASDCACGGGRSSGGTGSTCSPATDSGSRLVATTRTPGAARSTSSTTRAAASSRCSQLSSTSSSCLSRRYDRSNATGSVAVWSRRPSAASTALGTSAGSRTSASSTSQVPAGKPRPRSVAIRTASRVLPTPPGPTRLTRRPAVSFLLASASSRRRPRKLAASAGRLPDRWMGLATPRSYYAQPALN